MSEIESGIVPLKEISNVFPQYLEDIYAFQPSTTKPLLSEFFNNFKDGLYFYVEYPYVDKVFRSSYYQYYSTKHARYLRDCVRLSIFDKVISEDQFRDKSQFDYLRNSFKGYLIIRPTLPNIFGHSMISPTVINRNDFSCCLGKDNVLVNGLKLTIDAFPHSKQDIEHLTCAETTIWTIMQYFGNKYFDYKPILPAQIINTLSNFSYERLIPSKGLTINQISYALKHFGFGPRIYSIHSYNSTFSKILNIYIESGIPIIAALENSSIGHAVVLIGRVNHRLSDLPSLPVRTLNNGLKIKNLDDANKDFVIIDDNDFPYQLANIVSPTSYYINPQFNNCQITNFVAPLYSKIYLEAYQAQELIPLILEHPDYGLISPDVIITRLFLTSSRSFKYEINQLALNSDVKELILKTSMPKFIWICELSEENLFKNGQAKGMIVLDATEGNLTSFLFILYPDKIIYYNDSQINQLTISPGTFNIYNNNLKGF